MKLRAVLHAEGSGDTGGGLLPKAGEPVPADLQGPAHVLVRRLVEAEVPDVDLRFDAPLRTRARIARGSDFLHPKTLRQLLRYPGVVSAPDLAIVFVDSDGDRQRQNTLQRRVTDLDLPCIVGAATNEFEAWLITDLDAVREVLDATLPAMGRPDELPRGEAKRLLQRWIVSHAGAARVMEVRREIARRVNLETTASRCGSFGSFRRGLRELLDSLCRSAV